MNDIDRSIRPHTARPQRGSYGPLAIVFIGWLLCWGVGSAWENLRNRPACLVGRFEYYPALWKLGSLRAPREPVASLIAELRITLLKYDWTLNDKNYRR